MQFPIISCRHCHTELGPLEILQRRLERKSTLRCSDCSYPISQSIACIGLDPFEEENHEDDLKDLSSLIRSWDIKNIDTLIKKAFRLNKWTNRTIFQYLCYSFNYILERGIDLVLAFSKTQKYKRWIARGHVEHLTFAPLIYSRNPITCLQRFFSKRIRLAYDLFQSMAHHRADSLEYAFFFSFLNVFLNNQGSRYSPFPWWSFLPQDYTVFHEECVLCFENKHTFISVCSNNHRCCTDCLSNQQKSLVDTYKCFYCREAIFSY